MRGPQINACGMCVEDVLKYVIDDDASGELINSMTADGVFAVHDELYDMKAALELSTTAIIEGISNSGIDCGAGLRALSEINNLQKILDYLGLHVTWCHTGGAKTP